MVPPKPEKSCLQSSSEVFALLLSRLILLLFITTSLTFAQPARHRQRNKDRPTYRSSSKTKSPEVGRLAEDLRAQGGTVLLTKEKVSQPFFSVAGRIIKINGEAVQVFEYATHSAAEANARRVSADGTTIGTTASQLFIRPQCSLLLHGRSHTSVPTPRKSIYPIFKLVTSAIFPF